jgi:hypothetical protein
MYGGRGGRGGLTGFPGLGFSAAKAVTHAAATIRAVQRIAVNFFIGISSFQKSCHL